MAFSTVRTQLVIKKPAGFFYAVGMVTGAMGAAGLSEGNECRKLGGREYRG